MSSSSTEPLPPKLLELESVTRQFGNQMVLREVQVRVNRGETLVIIGESGCGKSVTLKLLCGLLNPTSGTVRFEGNAWGSRSERDRRMAQLVFRISLRERPCSTA